MDSCYNFFALPIKEFPAFGIAFNTTTQDNVSENEALLLPNNNPNPSVSIPVLLDVESTGSGLRVKKTGIYQLSYTLTVSLDNISIPPVDRESVIFFLTLNNVSNTIPSSGTAVRADFGGTGLVVVTSSVILINLNKGDLIQLIPTNIVGTVDVRSATLTLAQIA
ncbi:hypothetical protein CON64_05760 [Bacillus pseudomycoides]|nr:hypothetical protein CON64_05760 [Bacillus pseudomycoides]